MGWQDEARKAVGESWWQWFDGMCVWNAFANDEPETCHPFEVARYFDGEWVTYESDVFPADHEDTPAWILAWGCPDLQDAATVGCIRAEVERLCAERGYSTRWETSEAGMHRLRIYGHAHNMIWADSAYSSATTDLAGLCALRALRWLHEQ